MPTPLQIRNAANYPWPGDGQRIAARGVTVGEWNNILADKADADARRDAEAEFEVDPFDGFDLPDTPEVDIFDPCDPRETRD